jgi:hypothetical protein
MGWLVVAALLLSFAVVVAAGVVVVVRAVRLFRQIRATSRALGPEVERVAAGANEATVKAEALEHESAELTSAIARLKASQARLAVLLAAWNEVRASLGLVTAFVPRK